MLTEATKTTIRRAYKAILEKKKFRPRIGQRKMIAEVAKAVADDQHRIIVAEAPTGTGKSLAYLVGALPVALDTGKKLIISTSTVALQEQIANKDLPAFLENTGLRVKYVVAKGRGRYICPARLALKTGYSGRQPDMFGGQTADIEGENRLYGAMEDGLCSGLWDGDRDTFGVSIPDETWRPLTMDGGGCLGGVCRFAAECPLLTARAGIMDADVVITNHDLLLSDLAKGNTILPEIEECIVVLDEAHSITARAQNHFGAQIALSSLTTTLHEISPLVSQLQSVGERGKRSRKLKELSEAALDEAINLTRIIADIRVMLEGDFPDHVAEKTMLDEREIRRFRWGKVPDVIADKMREAAICSVLINEVLGKCSGAIKEAIKDGRSEHASAESLAGKIGECSSVLDRVIRVFDSFSNSTDSVVARWVEIYDRSNGQKEYSIEQRPTNVAGALKRTLWSRAHAVVVTSATLRSMGGFEHFRLKAGLPREPEAAYVDLESPFDYSRAALRIPTHAGADPANAKNHTDYIILSLPDLIESSGGTLVLFSSKAQLLKVREGLPEGVAQIILSQNDMPKNVLLAEHARRIAQGLPSVIFGLASFAEGVDLPGDLCRHVIIAKLPFEPPGGPVEATIAEAIEARGGNVFMEIMLPNVCIRLIQAVGRLIRQETDQGTITILDSRLKTKRYGRSLLSNLPSELRTIT